MLSDRACRAENDFHPARLNVGLVKLWLSGCVIVAGEAELSRCDEVRQEGRHH
jgi:hypothetical protein